MYANGWICFMLLRRPLKNDLDWFLTHQRWSLDQKDKFLVQAGACQDSWALRGLMFFLCWPPELRPRFLQAPTFWGIPVATAWTPGVNQGRHWRYLALFWRCFLWIFSGIEINHHFLGWFWWFFPGDLDTSKDTFEPLGVRVWSGKFRPCLGLDGGGHVQESLERPGSLNNFKHTFLIFFVSLVFLEKPFP